MRILRYVLLLLLCPVAVAQTGVTTTPPMGWSSWFYGYILHPPASQWPTEVQIKAQADALVSTGLAALGYKYINLDAGWNTTRVSGTMTTDSAKFPDGMGATADYIHAKGLKIGLYGAPGSHDCVNLPGTPPGGETADANAMAAWGIDFFKYDWCGASTLSPGDAYGAMGTALRASGRPIAYYVNFGQGGAIGYTWFQSLNGDTVRIGTDNAYVSVDSKSYGEADNSTNWALIRPYQNKGHWMEPDDLMGEMRELGTDDGSGFQGGVAVTDTEARQQFTHYAMLAAPLIIAADLTAMSTTTLQTYSNAEVIAVDQDSLGLMGYRVSQTPCGSTYCEVWVRQLSDGWAVELANRDPSSPHDIAATWSSFGQAGTLFNVRNLWAHTSVGSYPNGYTATAVPAMGAAIIKLTTRSFATQGLSMQGVSIQ